MREIFVRGCLQFIFQQSQTGKPSKGLKKGDKKENLVNYILFLRQLFSISVRNNVAHLFGVIFLMQLYKDF